MRRRSTRSPSRCTPRGPRCATCSCRSTAATRSTRWSMRPRGTRRATGRRVTYEYVMIDGINDTPRRRDALARLLRGQLRPRQPDPDEPGRAHAVAAEPTERIEAFAAMLRERGLETTVRRNRGVDIGAACGQLAADQAGAPAPAAVARRQRAARRPERSCAAALPAPSSSSGPAHGSRGRGEHPDRRLRQPLSRRAQARARRRRPPPPRRDGRPLRAQHHLRAGHRGGLPAADRTCRSTCT